MRRPNCGKCCDDACHLIQRVAFVMASLLFIGAGLPASAEESSPDTTEAEIEELKQRFELLEHENRELRSSLARHFSDSLVSPVADPIFALPPAPQYDDESTNDEADDGSMEILVDGMLRRLNAQSQSMIEAQNQRLSDLNRQVEGLSKTPPPTRMNGSFDKGILNFGSKDGNFKFHLGGTARLISFAPQSTAANISGLGGPNENISQDSTDFRRLRFRADGTMYRWVDWVFETEYSSWLQNTASTNSNLPDNGLRSVPGSLNGGQQGGNTQNFMMPANMFVQFKEIPVLGNIRVGNQQDWFSLDHVMGARFGDWMERAPIFDVFSGPSNNGFSPGVSVFNNAADKNTALQLGVYKNNAYDAATTFNVGNAFTYGGRAVWLPYYDEESSGRYLIHTAFGTEYRTFNVDVPAQQNGDNVRVRSRGDMRLTPRQIVGNYADTGNFFATDQAILDPEFALVYGPLTLQAEYAAGWFYGARTTQLAGGVPLDNVFFTSGYAEALYFLTGESKPYDRLRSAFTQVIPLNDFKPSEGKYGAWQVGVRLRLHELEFGNDQWRSVAERHDRIELVSESSHSLPVQHSAELH